MKKKGKCGCKAAALPAVAVCRKLEMGGASRKGKGYLSRLEDAGLMEPPIAATTKPPSLFQLAQLTATLAKDAPGSASAEELAGRAIEIWNASASPMFIAEMAAFVAQGVCLFDMEDWGTHCRSLIDLFDAARRAASGQGSVERLLDSRQEARVKACAAVTRIWKREELEKRGAEVVRLLFSAKSETEETRSQKLRSLLRFSREKVARCGELSSLAEDGKRLKACLLHAWQPLAFVAEDAKILELAAQMWLEQPEHVTLSNLGSFPMLARWLAVLRMEQVSEAKNRV